MGVTVGVVNYNLARFLPRAILSARRAQEVIVVDDRSTDNSMEIILIYPIRCILHKENSGSAVKGWNEIIDHASNEWLVFLSADDELTPRTIDLIGEHGEGSDWLWGNLELMNVGSEKTGLWDYADFPQSVTGCKGYIRRNLTLYPTMIAAFRVSWLRENKLRAVGFETTRGFADTITGWNWLKANPRLKYVPEVFAKYRRWGGSESNTADRAAFQKEFAEIVRRKD
jgi:glycosyltransferase involved in cell wall biosynthesis